MTDTTDSLLAAAAAGEIDALVEVTPEDLERLDEWTALGWVLLPCGCLVRAGGPFDDREIKFEKPVDSA